MATALPPEGQRRHQLIADRAVFYCGGRRPQEQSIVMNGANGSDSTASGSNQPSNQSSPVTVASLDAEFLPLIYDIVRSIEKESHDGTSGQKGSSSIGSSSGGGDYHLKVQELKDKLDKFRQQVNSINGIDISKDHQIDKVRIYKDQLDHKRKLLSKYKNNCPIEGVPKV